MIGHSNSSRRHCGTRRILLRVAVKVFLEVQLLKRVVVQKSCWNGFDLVQSSTKDRLLCNLEMD